MIFNETKTHEITVDVVIVTMKNNALHVNVQMNRLKISGQSPAGM